MDELTSTFIQESREQLEAMETGLLELESDPGNVDNINAVFRAAHTIKGGSGVIECSFLESFMHAAENVLDRLRNGEIAISAELTSLLLECCDQIGKLLDVLTAGEAAPPAEVAASGSALLERLQAYMEPAPGMPTSPADDPNAGVHKPGGVIVLNDSWHISVRFGRDVLRGGMEPLSFLRYLASLGEVLSLNTVADVMPNADEMDPESCYLGFEVRLQTRATKADIERVFDFCRDDCDLHILPPNSKVAEYIDLINSLPEDPMRIGELLVACGAVTQAELDEGLLAQLSPQQEGETTGSDGNNPLGEILVEKQVVQKEIVEAAVNRQAAVAEKKAVEARVIRVHADKLDHLIDLVGELVIAGASANLLAQRSHQTELTEATSVLSRLVENIRDTALRLRMVQIGETFNRFHRVVRDVSKELSKEIHLNITGAETELDKSVVEKIGDPLMHLVRNAMDHGIEPAAHRVEKGKTAHGTLGLNAYHDSGNIVIEVTDDGAGIPAEKIRAKAIEKGVIQATDNLSDQDLVNLIFEPGFSTADHITNISGRGVGMDVVRKNIESLRGTVAVETTPGQGSRFIIRLPLTLAIIDGFLTGVGKAGYVIPLESVVECIELHELSSERRYLDLRGEILPYVNLRELFDIKGGAPDRCSVVVVQYSGRKAGIVVDKLHGEFQTVIKPLGNLFRNLRGIGGSTILGSGEVALILDVPALVNMATQFEDLQLEHFSRGRQALPGAALQGV